MATSSIQAALFACQDVELACEFINHQTHSMQDLTPSSTWDCAGIKVDKGLVPLPNSNGESWCQGLDGLAQRTAEYYKAGARFAKWRSVVSIPAGPSRAALVDCAYGLARYAAIAQVCSVHHFVGRSSQREKSFVSLCCHSFQESFPSPCKCVLLCSLQSEKSSRLTPSQEIKRCSKTVVSAC